MHNPQGSDRFMAGFPSVPEEKDPGSSVFLRLCKEHTEDSTMEPSKVSKKLLKRLPLYLDHLRSMPKHSENVSATTLAKALGLGEVQVRKDLAKVSHTGRRRTGRSREQLILDIEKYLDFVTETGTVVVGAGKLGQALLEYSGFEEFGLNIMAGFDIHPVEKNSAHNKPIYPMNRLESFCKCYDVHIGIITVPAENAQAVCDCLVACGISAIWNFAPVHLQVPEHVAVQNENLAVSLSTLRLKTQGRTAQS
jgi:redox-sensing transcriptional repressor